MLLLALARVGLGRDDGKTSASAKRSALGSRADSGRMSTICCAATRNSCPAPLAGSCPNTSLHRSIRTSWRPCESRRTHPPSDLTNRCHEDGGRSGSTHRGTAGSASVSSRRTKNDAPCVSTTSGSATACSGWRPRTSGGIPTTAGMWFPMGWRCARCITRRWILGRWGWRGGGVGFGFWCLGGCGGGVRRRGGWWGCGGRGFGGRAGWRMRRIGGLWRGIGRRCFGGEGVVRVPMALTDVNSSFHCGNLALLSPEASAPRPWPIPLAVAKACQAAL